MKPSREVAFDPVRIELSGKNLVAASAGTGKTYAITTLFVRFLVERELEPSQILVVTFTEAATAELRDRVRARLLEAEAAFRAAVEGRAVDEPTLAGIIANRAGRLGGDLVRLRRAIENVDDAPISTIHGFCQRVLHDHALGTRVPFGAELVPDLSELADDVLYDFWQARVAHAGEGFARQVDALGVRVDSLRALFDEARRNPRIRVVPPAGGAPTLAELQAAFDGACSQYQRIDLSAFVNTHGNKSKVHKDAATRERLLTEVDLCLRQQSRAHPWVPAHAEQLFPGNAGALKGGAHPFFAAFERLARLAWAGVVGLEHTLVREATAELSARKLARGVFGFDDLLLRVADAVRGEGAEELCAALRARFEAVLIDEFQDTDPVQFEIFHGVFGDGRHPLFLIGDPKQAIYGFRGADVFAYLDAATGARTCSMDTSYRSDPGLVRAVNELFEPTSAFLIPGIVHRDVSARSSAVDAFDAPHLPGDSRSAALELLFLNRRRDDGAVNKPVARAAVARVTAADIAALLNGGATLLREGKPERVTAADVAVLTRTNDQCEVVQAALRERGIHSVVITDKSVFESEEAEDLQAVLGAVLDPGNRSHLRRAVASSLLGVSGDEIAERDQDPVFWQTWTERFRAWHELWVGRDFVRMFRALLDGAEAPGRLLRRAGGERRLTNVLHLGELLHRVAMEQHLGPAALATWLADQRIRRSAPAERAEVRLESDDAAVKILTVHKAKGLEFPIVYCPYLWAGGGGPKKGFCRFHDPSGVATLDIDVDSARRGASEARAAWESFAEEVRVVYVALTRAKHRTVVLWGGFNQLGGAAAAFLLHPPGALPPPQLPAGNRLGDLSDDDLARELVPFVRRCQGAAALRRVSWDFDASHTPAVDPVTQALAARQVERPIGSWQRTSSFSGLVKRGLDLDPDEGRDRDAEELSVEVPPLRTARAEERRRITLDGFPRGRRTGDLVHDVFEHIDFASVSDADLTRIAAGKLEAYGFARGFSPAEREPRRDQLVRALRETLETPLFEGGPRLRDIALARRFSELEFRVPVGEGSEWLTRHRLAEVFREHPSAALPADYAGRVEKLGFRAVSGFLKGYIDLVFEHDGRWYVVDYKTSHLGDHLDDYGPTAMTRELAESHYFLQYHLYALAVDRHLARAQRGYGYDARFGGVLYLFVKGMRSDAAPPRGVFFEKPPRARLEALSRALGGGKA